MALELTTATRLGVLENRMDQHETTLQEVLRVVNGLKDGIASTPQSIAWREIAATVLVMMGIFSYSGSYLEGQYHKNVSVLEYRLSQLELKSIAKP